MDRVAWENQADREYPVEIRLAAKNQRGVLATVATEIAQAGSNIEQVTVEDRDGAASTLIFVILVKDRVHLARIMKRLRAMPVVARITRARV